MDEQVGVDVLVVGGGAIGASSAYRLAAAGLRTALVDSLEGPASGSTGRSFASVRGQWADPLNIEISWRSIRAFRDFPDEHGIDVGYRPSGYLLLVGADAWAAQLDAVELQRAHGVPVEVLGFEAAKRITPFDETGLGGTTWGSADGVVDPHLVTSAWIELARRSGASVFFRSPVTAIDARADGGWTVRAGARTIRAQYVVNAAGGWAGEVAALAGFTVPVVHSRRNVYSSAPGALDRALPMTVDFASGAYLRSDGPRLLIGGARPDEVDGYNVAVDWPWMERVLERAVPRFPWLVDVPLDRAGCWAGTYENTPDHQGILGPEPSAPTWVNACGFSGHGLMQAPELGRLVAEQVTTGAITAVDASPLELSRFADASRVNQVELVF